MEGPETTADVPQISFKKRSAKSKSNFRKRPATPPPADSDDNSSAYSSSEDEAGHRIKRRRKNGVITATSAKTNAKNEDIEAPKIAADRSARIEETNDATRQSNWYEGDKEDDLSAKNLLGTTRSQGTGPESDGTYKGAANYQKFIQKNPNAPSKQIGPIKAPTNIRTITVTDFAPDVCKDYKQTGWCGFGDSCKFLHAREDYKQGWELDRDWEIGTKGKKLQGKTVASANRNKAGEEDESEDDELLQSIPFACIICKKPYTNPIVTKCGHYFCEKCALQRYRKNPNCAACGAGTGGVFNGAKRLKALLDKKRERARKQREKALENGEEVSSDEEAEEEGGDDD